MRFKNPFTRKKRAREEREREEILHTFAETFAEVLEKKQDLPDQYVVEYRLKSTDSLIGYHRSTFCQVTPNRLDAKRYSGDNPFNQLAIIHTNIKHVLNTKEGDSTLFSDLRLEIKNKYFKGYTIDDIYLQADYLEEGIPHQKFDITIL